MQAQSWVSSASVRGGKNSNDRAGTGNSRECGGSEACLGRASQRAMVLSAAISIGEGSWRAEREGKVCVLIKICL